MVIDNAAQRPYTRETLSILERRVRPAFYTMTLYVDR